VDPPQKKGHLVMHLKCRKKKNRAPSEGGMFEKGRWEGKKEDQRKPKAVNQKIETILPERKEASRPDVSLLARSARWPKTKTK